MEGNIINQKKDQNNVFVQKSSLQIKLKQNFSTGRIGQKDQTIFPIAQTLSVASNVHTKEC